MDDLEGLERATLALQIPKRREEPEEEDSSEDEGRGKVEDAPHRTYNVMVNSDGSFTMLPPGVAVDCEKGGGQTVFPITLPIRKVKNLEQPLVGAIELSSDSRFCRVRKTRPKAMLYNRESDEIYQVLPDGRQIVLAEGGTVVGEETPGMEVDPLAPQPQPQQPQPKPHFSGSAPRVQQSGIDVSEFEFGAELQPQDITSLENVLKSEQAREILEKMALEATGEGSEKMKPESVIARRPSRLTSRQSLPAEQTPATPTSVDNPPTSEQKVITPPRSTGGKSPSSAPPLNRRISQRQQDRIERQEAERILAENKEMLQREKEEMAAKANTPPPPAPVSLPVAAPVPPAQRPPTLTPRISSVSAQIQRQLSPLKDDAGGKGRAYPKRENRKIPAHLADPNYVSLDDSKLDLRRMELEEEEDGDFVVKEEPDTSVESLEGSQESMDEGMMEGEELVLGVSEDDPLKLWCICRQPHNNRFMICCDKCESWFHGKCVGITKAMGKTIEEANRIWHCPPCKRLLRAEAQEKKARLPPSSSRRNSNATASPASIASTPSPGPGTISTRRRSSDLVASAVPTPGDAKPKLKQSQLPSSWKGGTPTTTPASTPPPFSKTISKGGRRLELIDPKALTKTKPSSSPLSLSLAGKTSVSPPGTQGQPKPLVKKLSSSPGAKDTPTTTTPTKYPTSSRSVEQQREKEKTKSSRHSVQHESQRKSSIASPSTPTGSSSSSSSRHKEKEKEKEDKSSQRRKEEKEEATLRENMRKSLRDILTNRIKSSGEGEGVLGKNYKDPEAVATSVEAELVSCFGSWANIKCKNKYRSIIFNLKDVKNALYLDLLSGSLLAKDLVRMEPHQMASAEMTEWRLRQNQKELETIKRSEIEKLAEAKKQELIDAGTEFDKVVTAEQEERSKSITDVILLGDDVEVDKEEKDKVTLVEEKSKSSKSHGHGHSRSSKKHKRDRERHRDDKSRDKLHRHSSSSASDRKDKDSKKRDRSGERRKRSHSSRDKSSTKDVEKAKESTENKVLEPAVKEKEDQNIKMEVEEEGDESKGSQDEELATSNSITSATEDSLSLTDPFAAQVSSADSSEQELPSSTIKTPDFVQDTSKAAKDPVPVLKTKLIMPELGQFNAVAYNVSHARVGGLFFPESPVPIVGRITPEVVWDYINKMKKNKEIIIFRLAPASALDTEAYMSFFTYFSARGRFGVLGGIVAPLKDVYLIPLDKHSPINRILLPFRDGPGLPQDRSHCLLAVVTRHEQVKAPLMKRLSSGMISHPESSNKRPKLAQGLEIKAGLISSLVLSEKKEKEARKDSTPTPPEDDDQPYTPWDEEEDKEDSPEQGPDILPKLEKTQAEVLIQELNARIEREKMEIASIAVAISRKDKEEIVTPSGIIPGLDGEFQEKEEGRSSVDVPFFLRMPSLQAKPATETITLDLSPLESEGSPEPLPPGLD